MPSRVLLMITSSEESTIAARWARARSSSARSAVGAAVELELRVSVSSCGVIQPILIKASIPHGGDIHAKNAVPSIIVAGVGRLTLCTGNGTCCGGSPLARQGAHTGRTCQACRCRNDVGGEADNRAWAVHLPERRNSHSGGCSSIRGLHSRYCAPRYPGID